MRSNYVLVFLVLGFAWVVHIDKLEVVRHVTAR